MFFLRKNKISLVFVNKNFRFYFELCKNCAQLQQVHFVCCHCFLQTNNTASQTKCKSTFCLHFGTFCLQNVRKMFSKFSERKQVLCKKTLKSRQNLKKTFDLIYFETLHFYKIKMPVKMNPWLLHFVCKV